MIMIIINIIIIVGDKYIITIIFNFSLSPRLKRDCSKKRERE